MADSKRSFSSNHRSARVLIVDDHPIIRQGLRALINAEDDLEVCGDADDPDTGLDAVEEHRPDVAVVDLSYDGLSGIGFIKDLKARHPKLPVLVLSVHDELFYASRVLRAGAMGYVMKGEISDRVVDSIRRVLDGQICVSPNVCTQLVKGPSDDGEADDGEAAVETFSDRELEVFELLGHGLTTQQIAKRLHLSVKTVDSHRSKIKSKLDLDNSTQLVQYAIRWVEQAAERANAVGGA